MDYDTIVNDENNTEIEGNHRDMKMMLLGEVLVTSPLISYKYIYYYIFVLIWWCYKVNNEFLVIHKTDTCGKFSEKGLMLFLYYSCVLYF